MEKFDISLILPCFNEAEIFNNSADKIIKTLNSLPYTWEIIFIDDCSKDSTPRFIKNLVKKNPKLNLRAYFHRQNQGRGATVKEGFLKARGKIVGFLDIDLEIGEWYLPKFIQEIEKGADGAIARRIYDFNLAGLVRWLSSKGYSFLRQIILPLPYVDTEAGYKFFKKNKILPLLKKSSYGGWFWDTEIMFLASKYKLKIREIPVAFVRKLNKTSTVRLIPDTFNYLKDLLEFKLRLNEN